MYVCVRIYMYFFSSCTIGIVTTTSDRREYRKWCVVGNGGGVASSAGSCPAPVSLACFYHSSVLFACVRACCAAAAVALNGNVLPAAAPSYGRVRFPARALNENIIPGKMIRVGLYCGGPAIFQVSYSFFSTYRNTVRYIPTRARVSICK